MNSILRQLGCLISVTLVTGIALIVPVQGIAQQGQAILFSSPSDGNAATNVPSLTPQPPVFSGMVDTAPVQPMSLPSIADTMPPGPAIPSPQELSQMQQQLDEKENWALLTPAEILGVPTPEKILGLPEVDANGYPLGGTAAERFIQREQNAATNGMTNPGQWDLPTGETNSAAATVAVFGSINPTANSFFSELLGNTQNQPAHAQDQDPVDRFFSFGSPPPAAPQPTAEQIADDEAFQKLISPRSTPPTTAGWSGENASASQPIPGQTFATPLENSIGATFAPLNTVLQEPAGVRPLPGLVEPIKPVTMPEWQPQQPPWMSSTPQPGQIPQRNF